MLRSLSKKVAATSVFALTAAVMLPAPAAQAGTSCTLGIFCSTTYNRSTLGVLAVRDWNCSTGTTGTASTGCVNLNAPTRWIDPGKDTPHAEDWDAFRVDAGYCYRVRLRMPQKSWTETYNRSGLSTPVYVKVENVGLAVVEAQRYGSCP
jgi:hypothetical protein